MDDPWGSPWTSSAEHNQNGSSGNGNENGTANGNGGTPKPPQPALLAGGLSGNTPFASLPESSPWADDDDGGFGGFDDDNAFGDWTAADTHGGSLGGGGTTTPGSNGWGAFAETDGFGVDSGFGSGSNQHLSPQRKDKSTTYGGLGQLSPIAWPSSAALSPAGSPGGAGSPRRRRALSRRSSVNSLGSSRNGSRNGSLSGFARSPSVDPWSTAPMATEKRDDLGLLPGTTRARASSTLSIPILRLDDSSAGKGLEEEPQSMDDKTVTATPTVETAPPDLPEIVAEHVDSEDSEESTDNDDDEENGDTPKPPPQPTFPSIPPPSSSSRPSTAGSDGSRNHHHVDIDDPQQDSPTTSIEDDKGTTTSCTTAAATATATTTPQPHVVQRKSSSKVQGLVELYDGLAARPTATRSLSASSSTRDSSRHGSIVSDRSIDTTESPENEAAETTPKTTLAVGVPEPVPGSPASESALPTPKIGLKQEDELPEDKTKGDTEDDGEDDSEEASPEDSSEADHEETVAIPEAISEESKETSADEPLQATEVDTKVPTKEEESHKAPSTNKDADTDVLSASRLLALFGKQTYTLDQAKVDELYNDKDVKVKPRSKKKKDDGEEPLVLDAFIPDYILDDSFTAISERKVWYRIARHGSYRKHAAGGDDNENYRPVTWRTSAIRDDTVKIVRRWMEEDSFTGKPTLGGGFGRGLGGAGGGGNRSGNLFGWDSAAEPVALDEIFKRKKPSTTTGGGHKYNLSSASSAWANEGSGASADSPAGFSPGFSPAPVFGWGSNSNTQSHDHLPAKPESTRNSVQFERPMPSPVVAVPSPTTTQPSRFSVVLPPRDLAPTLPPSTAKEDTGAFADGDDDDDWGEMISSPVKEEFSIPPLSAPLSLPPAPSPVQAAPAFVAPPPKSHSPAPAPVLAPAPTPQLDERRLAELADSIISGLPDLSYMTV
ncbi:hypothetical protein Sste5346_001385 [Sporothrix stenoceras]|uniref:Glucan 1, 4-alpha-glucosidase n=1 Tax=Sporothrix stenoceras TaxID=5173 RepID=A0ABR3ZPR0_9PEZI